MGRVEIGLYILGALVVLVVVAWAASMFFGCMIERQWVVPVAPAPVDFDEPPPNFIVARNAATFDLGFSGGAAHVHPRGGSYRVQAFLWLSPDRRTLATVAGGTILSLEYRRVVLYSRLSDGRVLATVDQPFLENVSGLFVLAHGMDLDFREVWALHERRVAEAGPAVLPLTHDLLGALTGICLEKTRRLIAGGYACYADAERTTWRFTFRGAIAYWRDAVGQARERADPKPWRVRFGHPEPDTGFEVVPLPPPGAGGPDPPHDPPRDRT